MGKKSGLGSGLDALFRNEEAPYRREAETTLPISKVEPRSDQPRKAFDDAALEELTESIRQYGLIQPITVRRIDSGYYQIIAGERRWRAARAAGLTEVPVRILEADDRRAMELALVENLQREDLNPIEEARGYQTLMQEYGLTQEETAAAVGKSRPTVANALRLLGLSPATLALVEAGSLSAGHARWTCWSSLTRRKRGWQISGASATQSIIKGLTMVRKSIPRFIHVQNGKVPHQPCLSITSCKKVSHYEFGC